MADIEDLIAQKADAIIVMPVSSTLANASIEKPIPVVLHTGRIDSDAFTVGIQGAAGVRCWMATSCITTTALTLMAGTRTDPQSILARTCRQMLVAQRASRSAFAEVLREATGAK